VKRLKKFSKEGQLAAELMSAEAVAEYEKILIGKMIRKLRKNKKLKQESLAKLLKTSQSTVARIESGKQNLSLESLAAIALALDSRLDVRFLHKT